MNTFDIDTQALAPTGTLRAAINIGNPILAGLDPATGQARGVSVDLAQRLAGLLGLDLRLVTYDTAGKSVEGVTRDEADFGFFAIDPKRGEQIAFTTPYVLIEGSYLVRQDSPLTDNAQVDQAGRTVVVGRASAYDLFLSRDLKHASIVRAPTSPAVVSTFLEMGADVAAGVRQQLEMGALEFGGLRLLDGHFMLIRQALGISRSRDPGLAEGLTRFVEDAKASGFVAHALARHGIQGAEVAPTE
ncbi:ABC transporter substrate-binding protein [Castellaniella sp.]|uniref:ABC transporter substrate-binding protein n=1 Tax=Castellaniella sp. TaxID=1955812 RepID=UPI002AFE3788|nr:ABC transporter substrate-binding protein [Castellaniella sp.]